MRRVAPATQIGDYTLIKTLGTGTCGKVKLAKHIVTDEFVAIKIIRKMNVIEHPTLQKRIEQEISLMKLLDHPHILKLIEVLDSPRHIHLVLEYCENRELLDYLARTQSLREDKALDIFRQIIYGRDYLHSRLICHRDLKPENILVTGSGRICLADFGFARWIQSHARETRCGSPHYSAPEIIRGGAYDGFAADVWSAGVILFALLAVCFNF
jgi:BR serine/threonine kinase